MKKLLGLLSLSTSLISSLNLVVNLDSINNFTFKNIDKSSNDNPFIKQIPGLDSKLFLNRLAVDNTGVYECNDSGWLYKSNGIDPFAAMPQKLNLPSIRKIVVDNVGNIYAAGDGYGKPGVYKCLAGQTTFTKMTGIEGSLSVLNVDNVGNIYIGTNEGFLYKCLAGQTTFTKMIGIIGIIRSLVVSNNGTIWISNQAGRIYRGNGIDQFKLFLNPDDVLNQNNLAVDNFGNIYAGDDLGNIYRSNGTDLFTKISKINGSITSLDISSNGTIWIGTLNISDGTGSVYRSNGTDSLFTKISEITEGIVSLVISPDDTLYVGSLKANVYKITLTKNLINLENSPTYSGYKFNGFVYEQPQIVTLLNEYLKSATLDGLTIDIASTQHISSGKHYLKLILKDNYKQYLDLFGGNKSTGEITYNFWIKDSIIPENELSYKTVTSDTDLLTGLISNMGNSNGAPIIQTRERGGSSVITLNIKVDSNSIDLNKSYYVSGVVNAQTNDFTENGSKQKISKELSIKNGGAYQLHLVDIVNNTYDSYLELGQNNWKLQGTFDNKSFNDLADKLNVTIDLTDPTAQQEANGWLQKYETDIKTAFNKTVEQLGKGFIINTDDLVSGYKDFLNPIIYIDTNTKEAINQEKLNKIITDLANKKLNDGLKNLPDLNVDTKNVVDQITLTSYTNWINRYQKFINENKNQWFNKIINNASHGYATQEEINKISGYLNNLPFNKYLKSITWTSQENNLTMSNDYLQFIELDKLQNDIITFVNDNYPDVNKSYQEALNKSINDVNMHGYSLEEILNGKQLPQTKDEIDNFVDGKSFSQWLQDESNAKYSNWQLTMGLSIGIPLFLAVAFPIIYFYWRYNNKYNPKEYKMYKRLEKIDQKRFKQKKNKKKKAFLD